MINPFQIVVLAVIQGLAELLPVSSSAHVIVAAKLMGLDPASPEMTLLLVMLHSGTMFAVVVYFWAAWRRTFFLSRDAFRRIALLLVYSTLLTGLVGYPIKLGIEKIALRNVANAEIEMIFGNLTLVAVALAAAGCLIIYAGLRRSSPGEGKEEIGWREAGWMGAIQGLCLPFRGFSRSGATISTGLILGAAKSRSEEYSFALAVILTPPVVAREVKRVLESRHDVAVVGGSAWHLFGFSMLGLVLSFLAGLLALRWLSRWLEHGRWHFFGVYCLAASLGVLVLRYRGF
jgi:undecaprenyl-diphosphatase